MTSVTQRLPQCRYSMTANSCTETRSSLSTDDEFAAIQDRIRMLDVEILTLNEERARLLRRCNELKSPVRRCIPPEILSNIFRCVCPPVDFTTRHFDTSELVQRPGTSSSYGSYFPVVLGSVCSYWRQVAQSTPELWNTIVLDVRRSTAVDHAQLLQLYLSKSKALPFEIEVDFRREQKDNHAVPLLHRRSKILEALYPIQDVLFSPDTRSKIRTLRLIAPPCEWVSLIPTSYPHLEDISLAWPLRYSLRPAPSLELKLSNLRRLTRVTLSRELKLVLPWSQITHLRLFYLPIHICLNILLRCENLEKCRIRHTYAEMIPHSTPEARPVFLQHLQSLEWEPLPVPLMTTFFQRLHLPSLRRLRWEGIDALWAGEVQESALNFLHRLPETMTTLELVGGTFSRMVYQGTMIHSILNALPHIQILSLTGTIQAESALGNVLEALGLDNLDSRTGGPFLPALRVLEIKLSGARLPHPLLLNPLLIRMFMNRHLRSDIGLCVKLDAELQWTDDQKEEIRELVRAGFRLELWERNKLAKWIRSGAKRKEVAS